MCPLEVGNKNRGRIEKSRTVVDASNNLIIGVKGENPIHLVAAESIWVSNHPRVICLSAISFDPELVCVSRLVANTPDISAC